ncbi:uncharacterized protein LOC143463317 [Clavelina lepadiformis]|uniref:uncharacterized protein LOC143463317 n=1 Tax=Clavelina lepadiformis TaxID=159417 RepID=UPI0040414CF3
MEETFRTGRGTINENIHFPTQMHNYFHTESDSCDVRKHKQIDDLRKHSSVIRRSYPDEITQKYLETQKLNDFYKDQIEFLTQQLNIVVEVAPPESSRAAEWQEGNGKVLRIVRSNFTAKDQEKKLKSLSETISSLQKQMLRAKSIEDKMQELVKTTNEKLSAKDLVIEKLRAENSRAVAEKKNIQEKLALSENDKDMNRENLSSVEDKCRKLETLIQQAKADMDEKTSATRKYEIKLKETSQSNNQLSKENEVLQAEIKKLIKKSLDFEKKLSETNAQLANKKNIIADLEKNNANLKQHTEVLTTEADNKKKGNEAKLLHMMIDIEALKKATVNALKEKSQELQTLAQRYEAQQKNLQQQLESTGQLQEQLSMQLRVNAKLEETITRGKETSQSLQTDLEDKRKELERLGDLQKQSINNMERSKDVLHDELKEVVGVAEEKEKIISGLKKDNDMLNATLESLQQRLKSLQASRTATQEQQSSLEKENLQKENSDLKEEINRMKNEGNLRTARTVTAEPKPTSEAYKALAKKLQKAWEINKASDGIIKRLESERTALNKTVEKLVKDYKNVEEMYKTELKASRFIKSEDDTLTKAMEDRLKWSMVELERQSAETERLRGLHELNEEKLTQEIKALQDKIKSFENRVAQEMNDHSKTAEKLQGCRLALSTTRSELNDLQQALRSAKEEKEANKTALDEMHRTYERLQRSEQNVREQLKIAKDGSKSTHESLKIENENMEKENAKLEQNIEQLQDQLNIAKRDMQDKFMQSRDKVFELERENQNLENELNTLTSRHNLSERNSESLTATIDNLRQALQHSENIQGSLKTKHDEMAKKNYVLEEKLQKLEREKNSCKKELEDDKTKNMENKEVLEDLRTKVESLERALREEEVEWQKRNKTLQEEIKTLQQKTELVDTLDPVWLKRDLSNSRKIVSDLRQENESLKKKVLEAQKTNDKEIENLTNDLRSVNKERENLRKELENGQNVLKQQSAKFNALELEKQRREEKTHDLRRKSDELLKNIEELKRKLELLSKENEKKEVQRKTLQDDNAKLQAEIDVVNAKMSLFNQPSMKEKEIKILTSKLSQLQKQHEELQEATRGIDELKDYLREANTTKEKYYSDLLESLSAQKQYQNEVERLTRKNQELQYASDKQKLNVVRSEKIQSISVTKQADKASAIYIRDVSSDMKNENIKNREEIESLKHTIKAMQASNVLLDTELTQSKEIARKKDLIIERLNMNKKQTGSPKIALPATYVIENISSSSGNFYNDETIDIAIRTNDQQAKEKNTGFAQVEQSKQALEELQKKKDEIEKQNLSLKQQVERLKKEDNASLEDAKSKIIELRNEIEQQKIHVTDSIKFDELVSANEKLQSTLIEKENQIKTFQVTIDTLKDEIVKFKEYRESSRSRNEDEYGQGENTIESMKKALKSLFGEKKQLEEDLHGLLQQKGKWKEAEAKLNKKITSLQAVIEKMSLPEFRRQPSLQQGEDNAPYNNLSAENVLLKEKIRNLNVQLQTEKIKQDVELSNLNRLQHAREELLKEKEEKFVETEIKLRDLQEQLLESRSSSRSIDARQDFEMQRLKRQVGILEQKHQILENSEAVKDVINGCPLCTEIEKENKKLCEEVDRLRTELAHYDGYFLNEVDDLRYNYSESVKLNILYEDQLRELSQNYGVPIYIRVDDYDGGDKAKDAGSMTQIDGKEATTATNKPTESNQTNQQQQATEKN